MLARLDLVILNEGNTFTFRRGNTSSVIDITMALGWKVLEKVTFSDHQYIEFVLCTKSSRKGERATRTVKQNQKSR